MINTQYNSNNDIFFGRTATVVQSATTAEKSETAEKKVKVNKDTFEHHATESAQTYSPDSIAKSTKSVNATYMQDVATTLSQKKLIPRFLAAKIAGLNYDKNTGSPSINSGYEAQAYQNAINTIKGDHQKLSYSTDYCYKQIDDDKYGYTNARVSCPTYALATALSIKQGKMITPNQIETNSATDGTNTNWEKHGATRITANEEDALFAVDAQLQLGNPAIVHLETSNSQHWVTVIGKKDDDYIIIDPWDGKEKMLSDNIHYKKNGGSITDYVIISNMY